MPASTSTARHLRPCSVPLDSDGLVIARELCAAKPQLEPEICWGHDDTDVEAADVKLDAATETCSSLLLEDELVLLDTGEVTLYRAELHCTGCTCQLQTDPKLLTENQRTLPQASGQPVWLVVGDDNFGVPGSCRISLFQPDLEAVDYRSIWADFVPLIHVNMSSLGSY